MAAKKEAPREAPSVTSIVQTPDDLEIIRGKDPEWPDAITIRARVLDADGKPKGSLGITQIDEARWQSEGHEAIEAEIVAWALKLRQEKGL